MTDIQPAEKGDASFSDSWKELQDAKGQPSGDRPNAEVLPPETGADGDAEKPAPATDAADAPQPAAPETPDDIWANADPRFKAAFDAANERAAKAENLIRSNEGRWNASQRDAHQLKTRLAEIEAKLPASPPDDANASKADLDKLKEDYPEVAEPVLAELSRLESAVEALKADGASQKEQEAARQEADLARYVAAQETELAKIHPDWDATVRGQDFVNWVAASPRPIREAIQRNGNGIVDATEAIWVIDLFKKSLPEEASDALQQKRERQLDGSRAVPARTGTAPAAQPADDFSSEYKRLQDERRRKANRN